VSDVPLTTDETVLVATLARALVMTALADGGRGPRVDSEVLRAAYWLAARDGVTAGAVDARTAEELSIAELFERLQREVAPALTELDAVDLVREGIERALRDGNGAVRQRNAFRTGADFVALTQVQP
jgi:carboxylate-amine ligase